MSFGRPVVVDTGVLVSAAIEPGRAQAELIIASDPHLTGLHPWRDIPILPPAAFLVGVR